MKRSLRDTAKAINRGFNALGLPVRAEVREVGRYPTRVAIRLDTYDPRLLADELTEASETLQAALAALSGYQA